MTILSWKLNMRNSQWFHMIDYNLLKSPLTWNYQFNLLCHGSSELVWSVASISTLKLDEVLVVKHKSAIWVVCRDRWRNKIFAIFCPSVSVGAKYTVCFHQLTTDIQNVLCSSSSCSSVVVFDRVTYSGGGLPLASQLNVTLWSKGRAIMGPVLWVIMVGGCSTIIWRHIHTKWSHKMFNVNISDYSFHAPFFVYFSSATSYSFLLPCIRLRGEAQLYAQHCIICTNKVP